MRLATPGAILMFAGILIMWWGLGIVRGEVGSSGGSGGGGRFTKRIGGTLPKVTPERTGGAGGDARLQ